MFAVVMVFFFRCVSGVCVSGVLARIVPGGLFTARMSLTSAKPFCRRRLAATEDQSPPAQHAADSRLGRIQLSPIGSGNWPTGMAIAFGMVPPATSPGLRTSTICRSAEL